MSILYVAYDGDPNIGLPLFVGDTLAEIDRHFHVEVGNAKQALRQSTKLKGMSIVKVVLDNDLVEGVA